MRGLARVVVVGSILVGCAADDAPPPISCLTESCGGQVERAVLFGGAPNDGDVTLNDTWSWDGAAWKQETASGPPAREWAQATALNGSMVVYSGYGDGNLQDTWTWNGTSWAEDASGMYPIYGGGMSALNGEAVLFGGDDDWGLPDWETWTWNGASWTQLNALDNGGDWLIDPQMGAPTNIYAFTMTTLNDTIVLFGGEDNAGNVLNATWTWNGTSWSWLDIAGPQPRIAPAMAGLNGKVVLFGGFDVNGNALNDTWIWDGTSWTAANVSGPSARWGHVMTTVDNAIVLFGGQSDKTTMLDDTWIWSGSSWTKADVAGPSARSSAVMATITPAHVATPPAFAP
jgi:hypothetical protein